MGLGLGDGEMVRVGISVIVDDGWCDDEMIRVVVEFE